MAAENRRKARLFKAVGIAGLVALALPVFTGGLVVCRKDRYYSTNVPVTEGIILNLCPEATCYSVRWPMLFYYYHFGSDQKLAVEIVDRSAKAKGVLVRDCRLTLLDTGRVISVLGGNRDQPLPIALSTENRGQKWRSGRGNLTVLEDMGSQQWTCTISGEFIDEEDRATPFLIHSDLTVMKQWSVTTRWISWYQGFVP